MFVWLNCCVVALEMHAFMVVWLYGCMVVCLHVCLLIRFYGCIVLWLHACMLSSLCGCVVAGL